MHAGQNCNVPYFLEISPHLEIPPPSKSRRTYKEARFQQTPPSKSRRMEKGRRIQSTRNAGAQCTRTICTIEMDECAGARRVSGLVAALEISPPSKFRRRVQRLEIKSRRGEISRKYGMSCLSAHGCVSRTLLKF